MTDQTDAPAESDVPTEAIADPDARPAPEDVVPESPESPEDVQAEDVQAEDVQAQSVEAEDVEAGNVEAEDVDAADSEADDSAGSSPGDRVKELESEGDIAADYLEELLDIADLDGDLDMDVEGDRAAVSIVGEGLDALVGTDGEVLEALQELTRLAVYRDTGERSRLMLDIGGFRADVRKNLVALAEEAIEEVRESGEAVKLAPMSPFERKVVHDAVGAAGLRSESEGVEPTRCVVIHPAD